MRLCPEPVKLSWDFRFSRRLVWRWLSSGMLRRVVWYKFTDGSEVPAASIIRRWLLPHYTAQHPRRQSYPVKLSPHNCFCNDHFTIILLREPTSRNPNGFFPSGCPANALYASFTPALRATCSDHPILDLIALKFIGDYLKLWIAFLRFSVTSSLSGKVLLRFKLLFNWLWIGRSFWRILWQYYEGRIAKRKYELAEIWGSHGGEYEDSCLLGCCAM
jgi:hypothetical protein